MLSEIFRNRAPDRPYQILTEI